MAVFNAHKFNAEYGIKKHSIYSARKIFLIYCVCSNIRTNKFSTKFIQSMYAIALFKATFNKLSKNEKIFHVTVPISGSYKEFFKTISELSYLA